MQTLVENEYWILPKPKYVNITPNESGITLSSLWTIYVNKYRIKDNALFLSSKFNRHFNTFLNTIPIRDSTLDEKWGEYNYIAVITPESDYEKRIKFNMNEIVKNHLGQYDAILDSCCFELYPNQLKSKLPLDESYYINISKGSIWVLSTSPNGFYYGIQTLVQIIEHTIFQIENLENYIILPTMTIVDFPDMNYRGISVDLNSFTPSFKALSDLIPFLVKCKLNNIVTIHNSKFPYTDEENTKFRDLCKFHHIQLSHISNLEELNEHKVKTIQFQMNGRFILPDYKLSLDIIEKTCKTLSDKFEGVLISTLKNCNCPLDLQMPLFPMISDMLWNSKIPVTNKKWVYVMEGAHLNLFEDSLQKSTFDFRKMAQFSSTILQGGEEQIDKRITEIGTL
ncbi:MAG: hypothetical protein EU530_11640, partial [Promethearchaeota archaeon]